MENSRTNRSSRTTTITTVRAAMRAIANEGWTPPNRYQLGAAMGPVKLYVLSLATARECNPLQTTDPANRQWLQVFTQPDLLFLDVGRVVQHQICYRELAGTAVLDLACQTGSGVVLDVGTPLECRIPAKEVQSVHVAASYTESLARAAAERAIA